VYYSNATANVGKNDCQNYETKQQRSNCRISAEKYCAQVRGGDKGRGGENERGGERESCTAHRCAERARIEGEDE
jgi:hypothetical protein